MGFRLARLSSVQKTHQQIDDTTLLKWADGLATRRRVVWIVVDACFSGRLGDNAASVLNKHRDPNQGGVVLMLSSVASQTSAALGQFSAFAHSVDVAMKGQGDLNHDGKITLAELKAFSRKETLSLTKQVQRTEFRQSPSIRETYVVALTGGTPRPVVAAPLRVPQATPPATVLRPAAIASR